MANFKKPPLATPAKPVTAKVVAANPAPAKIAPAAPTVAKPVVVSAPVAAPVVAKPAPIASVKVEAPKVEIAKSAPAKVQAPKPVAPVTAKTVAPVAAPAQKPVEAMKPVIAAKPAAIAAQVVAPKPASQPVAKATSSIPAVAVLKPVAAMQENMRANTEKALTEFRGRYAEVRGFAETANNSLDSSMKAVQSGSRQISNALFEIVKAQAHANLDHAKTLAAAKSLPEMLQVQQAFVLSQFQSAQTRTKDVATLAGKIASDVTSPLRTSFESMLRR